MKPAPYPCFKVLCIFLYRMHYIDKYWMFRFVCPPTYLFPKTSTLLTGLVMLSCRFHIGHSSICFIYSPDAGCFGALSYLNICCLLVFQHFDMNDASILACNITFQ